MFCQCITDLARPCQGERNAFVIARIRAEMDAERTGAKLGSWLLISAEGKALHNYMPSRHCYLQSYLGQERDSVEINPLSLIYTRTHARTHARTHTHTHKDAQGK
jgi:hypothetical protein